MNKVIALILIAGSISLTACGMQGPLYVAGKGIVGISPNEEDVKHLAGSSSDGSSGTEAADDKVAGAERKVSAIAKDGAKSESYVCDATSAEAIALGAGSYSLADGRSCNK